MDNAIIVSGSKIETCRDTVLTDMISIRFLRGGVIRKSSIIILVLLGFLLRNTLPSALVTVTIQLTSNIANTKVSHWFWKLNR